MGERTVKVSGCPECGGRGWKPERDGSASMCECARERARKIRRIRAGISASGYALSPKQKALLTKIKNHPGSFILASRKHQELQDVAGAYLDFVLSGGVRGMYCSLPIVEGEFGKLLQLEVLIADGVGKFDGLVRERIRLGKKTIVLAVIPENENRLGAFGLPVIVYD